MRNKRLFSLLAATAGIMAVAAAPASAREFRVDDDHAQCPNAQFTTIQAAVTAAGPNDTVKVCPGTYPEQVRIETHAKDGLKLESLTPLTAKIQFPPLDISTPRALVLVRGADDVTVRDFTIRGPYNTPGCAEALDRHYGVRVDGDGSATIRDNHITQIRPSNPALEGCQDGVAVLVGRNFEQEVGHADVRHNVIDNYAKNGPTIDGPGSTALVRDNLIDGGPASTFTARNGIQVGRGAHADVHLNEVVNNSFIGATDPPAQDQDTSNDSTGILVFSETGGVEVSNNTLRSNDLGLDVGTASNVLIRNNFARSNRFDGLRAESDTQQNLFAENTSRDNGTHDCHDDSHGSGTAGTGNIWKNDFGVTQTPPGICRPDGNH
jgi:parallel beta helix pectate lyase-like protein